MADLSGKPKEALKPLKDRKVVTVDRDNFNDVLAKATPRLAFKADNKLTDETTKLAVELNFKEMDDFEPARVASQVGPLKELLEMRQRLTQLLSKMEGNDKLEELLANVLNNTEQATQLAGEMGILMPGAAGSASGAVRSLRGRRRVGPFTDTHRHRHVEGAHRLLVGVHRRRFLRAAVPHALLQDRRGKTQDRRLPAQDADPW